MIRTQKAPNIGVKYKLYIKIRYMKKIHML